MRAKRRALILLMAALLLLPLLSGCIGDLYSLERGKLMVGTDPGLEPFSFRKDGVVTGFDIDIAREIARRLKLKLVVEPVQWDFLISGLFAENYDVIVSSMTITPKRLKEIDFIGPYFRTDQAIVVKDGSGIAGKDDLRGKTVGVLEATTSLDLARQLKIFKEIKQYSALGKTYDALDRGEVDAVIDDQDTARSMAARRSGIHVAEIIRTGEQYGIGILDAKSRLGRDIQSALTTIMNDGTYQEIYRRWFGTLPPD